MKCVPSIAVVILMVCFSKVCCVRISVSEGQSVVLPCSLPPGKDSTLMWMYRETKPILKVRGGQVEKVDSRVETFLPEQRKGNFSIKISDVRVNDSGRYQCHLQPEGFQKIVELNVTERAVGGNDESRVRPGGGAVSPQLSWLLILPLVFLCV